MPSIEADVQVARVLHLLALLNTASLDLEGDILLKSYPYLKLAGYQAHTDRPLLNIV